MTTNSTPPAARTTLHTLDLLRGIAAIAVVSFHFKNYFGIASFAAGYLAVDLFFIMSGVVIDYAYRKRLSTDMSPLAFVARRFIRLSPLHITALCIGVLIATMGMILGGGNWTPLRLTAAVFTALLFLPVPFETAAGAAFPLNPPTWSLAIEVAINIVYAVVVRLLSTTVLVLVIAAAGAMLILIALQHGHLDVGANLDDFYLGGPRVLFGFSLGVLIARSRFISMPRNSSGVIEIVIVLAAAVVLYAPFDGVVPRAIWDVLSVLFILPMVVVLGVAFNPPVWLIRPSAFLGVTSYAIYVLHVPMLAILDRILQKFPLVQNSAPLSGVVLLCLIVAIAYAANAALDAPIRRKLTDMLARRERGGRNLERFPAG